jgi:hypothetical protein
VSIPRIPGRLVLALALVLAIIGLGTAARTIGRDSRHTARAGRAAAAAPLVAAANPNTAAVQTPARVDTSATKSQKPKARKTPSAGEAKEAEEEEAEARERKMEEREKKYGPRPDHPGEAMAFRMLSYRDENGYIPPDGLMKAKAHVNEMRALAASGAAPPAAGISRGGWTWKGPGNIGGRTRAIAIDPANANNILAGTVGGGIWRSTNAGASWAPVDDFMANLAVTSIVYQPGSPGIVYAGTGEGFFNGDAIRGAGIFRSADNGLTWTQLPSTANSNFFFVNRLAFSADGSILLAATSTGVRRSLDGGTSWGSGPVLTLTGSGFGGVVATDVKFLTSSNTLAVASGYNGIAYWSNDGGASFTAATGFSGFSSYGSTFTRVELAPSRTITNNVYAMLDSSNGKLYKSTDGGVSYTFVSTPGHLSGQGWYNNAMWVAPDTENVLVIGGLDLYRSIDFGATWAKISTWFIAPTSAHADNHAIVSDVGYSGANPRVYIGNDGGVYRADNILATPTGGPSAPTIPFTFLNNNFGATQFYGAAGNASSGRITGGTQDNGDLFLNTGGGTQSWGPRFGGDGGFSAYDSSDPNYFYGEYVYLQIHRNSTGGASSSQDIYGSNGGSCKAAPYRIDDACLTSGGNFIAPFILDPNNPQSMLAGAGALWRTTDVRAALTPTTGPQWTNIKPTIGSAINAIAVAPGNSLLIYVGHNNGDVYMTTTGGAPWTKVDSATMPNSQVQRIAIDPLNNNTVYVAFGSFGSTNLWKTTNGGGLWNPAVGSGGTALPSAPIRGIAIHPSVAGYVYVGTEVGVFASTDGGASWSLPHDGPANVSVDELSWMGNTLVAATHGRGIYTTTPIATFPTLLAFNGPAAGSSVSAPFTTQGWALNQGATTGTGVSAVHLYLGPTGGPQSFFGLATYGVSRPDVGAIFGPQFNDSGFAFTGGAGLAAGSYTLTAYAQNAMTGIFDAAQSVTFNVTAPTTIPFIDLDTPREGYVTTSAFEVGGWALDAGSPTGTGVDAVQFYVFPNDGAAPGVFIGTGSYGLSRPDVGGIFGSRFTNSGFHYTISGLGPGAFVLGVYARSTVTGTFSVVKLIHFTVNATALMALNPPEAEAVITTNIFNVDGWSIDRAIEITAIAGSGVDTLHVYAYPNPGSGAPPIFLGVASVGLGRPDVAALYGSRYDTSGYHLGIDRSALGLAPGPYNIVVHSHSTVSGTFNNAAIVRVTLQ